MINSKKVSIAPDGSKFNIPSEEEILTHFNEISEKAEWHKNKGRQVVVVQGLGFVGSAVAAAIASAKDSNGNPLHYVIGVDLPTASGYWKVAKINDGKEPITSPDPKLADLIYKAVHQSDNLVATVAEAVYSLADVIVVDVPLDVQHKAGSSYKKIKVELSSVKAAFQVIGRYMPPNTLVIIETTVPAGFSETIAKPILEEEREKRKIDKRLLLAHAYERVMPGPNYIDSIKKYWRVYSGINEESKTKAREFLSSFTDIDNYPLTELTTPADSELAKLLENSYRAANIAFIYEWTLLAEKMGVNLFEVIDAIQVRRGTHDNIRFPGFGVGGYCLTKDSFLAQWSAQNVYDSDVVLNITLESMEINHLMPLHTLELLRELANGDLSDKTIVVCGVTYLPDVADTRNSPTKLLVDELSNRESSIILHDPYLRNWDEYPDKVIYQDLFECLAGADGVVFAVPHKMYLEINIDELLNNLSTPFFIVDAQNIFTDQTAEYLYNSGCRLLGVGKGHWRALGYQR